MNASDPKKFVYLLVDNGLLHEASASYVEADSTSRPAWLVPIYAERALSVSPILIDLEAAYDAGDLDQVMILLNAYRPALHVSIIETVLDLGQLAQHLQRFIFIVDPEGKQFTLRYADCTILALLPSVFTPAQWAAMKGPIERWEIHDRSGAIFQLPHAELAESEKPPFSLSADQMTALDEASEADHCIAKVKMMRHGRPLPGNPAEQYRWAQTAYQSWITAHNPNALILTFLTEAAIVSQGRILRSQKLDDLLTLHDPSIFRNKLHELVYQAFEIKIDAR